MSENHRLGTSVLKEEWKSDRYVISDWFGTVSTVGAANSCLNAEILGTTVEEAA